MKTAKSIIGLLLVIALGLSGIVIPDAKASTLDWFVYPSLKRVDDGRISWDPCYSPEDTDTDYKDKVWIHTCEGDKITLLAAPDTESYDPNYDEDDPLNNDPSEEYSEKQYYLKRKYGSKYSFKWYKYDKGNKVNSVLSTSSELSINSVKSSDSYSNGTFYRCEFYYDGEHCADGDYYIVLTSREYYAVPFPERVPVQIGEEYDLSVKLNCELWLEYDDDYMDFDDIDKTSSKYSYKWYKCPNGNKQNTVLSTSSTYRVKPTSNSDYYDNTETYYICELYVNGVRKDTAEFELYNPTTSNIYIGEKQVYNNGVLSGDLPSGFNYNKNTNTVTLNSYSGDNDISFDGNINIILEGENSFNGLGSDGEMTISGSGKLSLINGIYAQHQLNIKDTSISINNNSSSTFYGLELMPWENIYKGYSNCKISIVNSDVDIVSTVPKGNKIFNIGIDAQDADLVIKNSKVNLKLTNGVTWGYLVGLNRDGKHYGGKFSVDNKSNLIFRGFNCEYPNDNTYATYFYEDDINADYIYTGRLIKDDDYYYSGSNTKGILTSKKDAFEGLWYEEGDRYECTGLFMEMTSDKRESDYSGLQKNTNTSNTSKSTKKITNKQPTSIKKIKAKKKKLKVTWKKIKGINGYQLQCSLKKNFKKSKVVNINKASTTSTTIKKLKKKKKYFVRIRTYKTVSKKKYYSSWSKPKAKKTK